MQLSRERIKGKKERELLLYKSGQNKKRTKMEGGTENGFRGKVPDIHERAQSNVFVCVSLLIFFSISLLSFFIPFIYFFKLGRFDPKFQVTFTL